MTTSGMTERQINRACEIFRAQLTKHAPELPSDAVQRAFGDPELAKEWLAVFRRRVEVFSGLIVRRVAVNRNRTSQEVLDATGRKQYTDREVIDAMPSGEGNEVEVIFFKIGRRVCGDELEKEYDLRGLKPVDPDVLAAVNKADPAFADNHPNCTIWKDTNGRWRFATLVRGLGGRGMCVSRDDDDLDDRWFFGGVRKAA